MATAANHVTITGNLLADPKIEDRRPSSFRMASYCSGGGDNVRQVFITVKSFDHAAVAELSKGSRVTVEARFDTFTIPKKEGERYDTQVIELMADDGGITQVDRDGNALRRSKAAHPHSGRSQPEPDYDYDEDAEPF